MSRASSHRPDTHRWMVSYMDVLTILLIFFIAAAAQATRPVVVEKPVVEKAVPPPVEKIVEKPVERLAEPEKKLAALGLDLKMEPRGLVISLPQAILFGSGEDAISVEARPLVEEIAEILQEIPNKVSLIGHADAVPIHNKRFRNNWELAASRSLRLAELLGKDGIDEARLSVVSDSSFDPRDTNETKDGRAHNRRVEIVILDPR